MKLLTLRLFYILPVLVWLFLIFGASTDAGSAPHTAQNIGRLINFLEPGYGDTLSQEQISAANFLVRKLAHITEYTILTLLVFRMFQFGGSQFKPKRWILAGICCLLYASSDEIHQIFVPGRTAHLHDVLIDGVGVAVAIVFSGLFFLLKHVEQRLRTVDNSRDEQII